MFCAMVEKTGEEGVPRRGDEGKYAEEKSVFCSMVEKTGEEGKYARRGYSVQWSKKKTLWRAHQNYQRLLGVRPPALLNGG